MIPPPPPPTGQDLIERVRTTLDQLDDRPIGDHVAVLSNSLDVIVGELDDMARRIPSAT